MIKGRGQGGQYKNQKTKHVDTRKGDDSFVSSKILICYYGSENGSDCNKSDATKYKRVVERTIAP